MAVFRKTFGLKTKSGAIVDISNEVSDIVHESGLKNGIACVFVPGSTGAVTTIEYEDGVLHDLSRAIERLMPQNMEYRHNSRWGDGNGHSHVRASVLGPSITVPFTDRRLELGTWQQLVFLELDVRGRSREIVVQVVGE
jgi:secondary thiamine-phosphate synthase enzyme